MARRRDYQAEYRRRQERSQRIGWRGYSQERKAKREYVASPDLQFSWLLAGREINPEADQAAFAAWYRGLHDRTDSKRRDSKSAKAKWFVEYRGLMTYSQWRERYG